MTGKAKGKGDRGEREVVALLQELLDNPKIERALGAGRREDVGDIFGIPDTVIQVSWRNDIGFAITQKLPECEQQQDNAHAAFGALFIRRDHERWIVVQSPEQFADLWKAANE